MGIFASLQFILSSLAMAKAGATEREFQQTRKSATYQDEAYAMFLSDIEKDMLKRWEEQIKMSDGLGNVIEKSFV